MTDLKTKRLLMVEDEPIVIELMKFFLNKYGFEVETVSDGALVIKKVEQMNPDLIILDIMLPNVNGFDICK